jgi:WD40 repeat protein
MGGINDIALANDQVTVLSVGSEKKVTYWDLRSAEPVRVIDYGRETEGMSISLSNDNRYFVTAGSDQAVRLWDFRTGRCLSEGLGHSKTVLKARFSEDDKQVVSVGTDGCILVWNIWNE